MSRVLAVTREQASRVDPFVKYALTTDDDQTPRLRQFRRDEPESIQQIEMAFVVNQIGDNHHYERVAGQIEEQQEGGPIAGRPVSVFSVVIVGA